MASSSSTSSPPPLWDILASEVASLFGLHNERSPTLMATIDRGVRYVEISDSDSTIVFGARALVIGFIADRSIGSGYDTGSWFHEWLRARIPERTLVLAMDNGKSDPERVFFRYEKDFRVALSAQVSKLLPMATSFSQKVSGRPEFEARHFFAAMVQSGFLERQLKEIFGLSIGGMVFDLKRHMIERMLEQPARGETLMNWASVFSLTKSEILELLPRAQAARSVAGRNAETAKVERPNSAKTTPPTASNVIVQFLESLQIRASTRLARSIIDRASRIGPATAGQGDIDTMDILIACLGIGNPTPRAAEEALPLRVLRALSRNPQYSVMVSPRKSHQLASSVPSMIFATKNAAAVLRQAAQKAPSWFEEESGLSATSIVAALLSRKGTQLERNLIRHDLTLESLQRVFVGKIREHGGDWQRWAIIFGLSTDEHEGDQSENLPAIPAVESADVYVIAGLGNDSPDRASLDDQLGAEQEAHAFARIAAARNVVPPLAFGIFGEWGSGKSFFMRLMHKSVEELSEGAKQSKGTSPYYGNIVQIRFNAWHYAESNLWASLVNHIFVELDRWSEGESAAKDGLLGKLMTARKLSTEAAERLVAQRQQQKLAAERLAAARRELAIRREQAGGTPRMFWSAVGKSFLAVNDAEAVKAAAAKLGLAELADDAEDLKRTLDDVAGDVGRGQVLAQGFSARLRSRPSLVWILAAFIVVPFTLSYAYHSMAASQSLAWITEYLRQWVLLLAGFLGTVAVWIEAVRRQVRKGLMTLEGYRNKLDEAIEAQLTSPSEAVKKAESRLAQLTADAAEATALLSATSDRLAHAANDYETGSGRDRLLKFVRERAGIDGYGKHLGLIASIRKDFTQLSDLMSVVDEQTGTDIRMQQNEQARRIAALLASAGKDFLRPEEREQLLKLAEPAVPSQKDKFDRIVLYIDDLDRCPPEQVVHVLQAVHLLLSFPLFVVVVAVDTRWVSRALEKHYEGLLGSGGAASASDYLEKIVQVPYWVRSMTDETSRALVKSLAEAAGMAAPAVAEETIPADPTDAGPAFGEDENPVQPEVPDESETAGPGRTTQAGEKEGAEKDTPPVKPKAAGKSAFADSRALTLTPQEVAFMETIARRIGSTPRRALRFVNIYRIIKASLDGRDRQRLETSDYPFLMAQLAIVTGAPLLAGAWANFLGAAAADTDPSDALKFDDVGAHGDMLHDLFAAISVLTASRPYTTRDFRRYWEIASRFSFTRGADGGDTTWAADPLEPPGIMS